MADLNKRLRVLLSKFIPFKSSADYWDKRYKLGGTSGQGSYDVYAEFKARVLNHFVKAHGVNDVIEFGCGDGNQLKYFDFPSYLGLDVSPKAIEICTEMFSGDSSKHFLTLNDYKGQEADLALSLDVIFHLVEDDVFEDYMRALFKAGKKFVIIYSSNSSDVNWFDRAHVKHREFVNWVSSNMTDWELMEEVPTVIKGKEDTKTALKSFFIYRKK